MTQRDLVGNEGSAETAALVKRIRAQRGLTQEGLARELGVSFATINGWENGRHRPIPALARRLAELASSAHDAPVPPPTSPPACMSAAPAVASLDVAEVLPPAVLADVPRRVASSGWPTDERERRDFHHRPREFPPGVNRWRAAMIARLRDEPERSPLAARAVRAALARARRAAVEKLTGEAEEQLIVETLRALIDDLLSALREVARIAAVLHGTPRLGNHDDPVDELIYIILSRKTREDAYQRTFAALKSRFPRWEDVLDAPPDEIERIVSPGGLGEKKALSIIGALRAVKERFGACTMEPARSWSDAELEAFLVSLPEVSRKSAYCVMMFAFHREVLPVDAHVGRVMSRLDLYRDLGLGLEGLDHKQLQAILPELIPPDLRPALHVNLLVHGREICRAQKPLCTECDLRGFCGHFRRGEVQRVEALGRPRVVDLFAGGGGLSEGFEREGFEVALVVDADPVAMRTYRFNHPAVREDRILCRDIRSFEKGELRRLAGRRHIDVLIGAPPCQGFSHVGHRSKRTKTGYSIRDDARNYLYENMVAAALELRPSLFLMENVPGMKSARKGDISFLDEASRSLERAGFRTATWRLNAAAFGVPQDRVRYFLVAALDARFPERPIELYQDSLAREFDPHALPPITFDEATFDLPPLGANDGDVVSLWPRRERIDDDARFRRYLQKLGILSRSRLLFNHTVRYHNERDLELYALLQPGEDSVHAIERYGRADLMRYRADVFDDKYARLRGDRPCKTIVSHLAKDGNGYIHPSQVRSISFREAARIQSFRDDYVFCGSPTDQWVHLGNAVPPVMAAAIARSFLAALAKET
ncbi:DNA (cytosine-5-)-methyltransferase [Sorangium sp. So ce362]|uniref:DNA (cytosine-5-)-methyltransferase n=1 Tax=Sorangium sp. So ce362 TaxID=3133303 RepID=UPI003F5F8FA3